MSDDEYGNKGSFDYNEDYAEDEMGSSADHSDVGPSSDSSIDGSFDFDEATSTEHEDGRQSRAAIYTDGACSRNGQPDAMAGIGIHWGPGDSRNISERLYDGRQTNQRAALAAGAVALHQADDFGYRSVDLYTDSQYLQRSVEEYIPRWIENGWRTSNGGEVANRPEMERLHDLTQRFDSLHVHHTPKDSCPGNRAADELAKYGAAERYKY